MREIKLVITDDGRVQVYVPEDVTDIEVHGALAIFDRVVNVTKDVQLVRALNQYDDRPMIDPEEVLP